MGWGGGGGGGAAAVILTSGARATEGWLESGKTLCFNIVVFNSKTNLSWMVRFPLGT